MTLRLIPKWFILWFLKVFGSRSKVFAAQNIFYMDALKAAKSIHKRTGILKKNLIKDMLHCYLKYGASIEDYQAYNFYRLNDFGRREFLCTNSYMSMRDLINPKGVEWDILSSKNKTNKLFHEFLGRSYIYCGEVSEEQIMAFTKEQGKFIVKPDGEYAGAGIYVTSFDELEDPLGFCREVRKKKMIIEELVEQHSDTAQVNPESLNTIRINTVIDANGIAQIFTAAFRMGVGNVKIDTLHRGGIAAPVDLKTGKLCSPAYGVDAMPHREHPHTGVFLLGLQLPFWEDAKWMVLKAAARIPQIRLIGWDVAITAQGPILIEGNQHPGLFPLQMLDQTGIRQKFLMFLTKNLNEKNHDMHLTNLLSRVD